MTRCEHCGQDVDFYPHGEHGKGVCSVAAKRSDPPGPIYAGVERSGDEFFIWVSALHEYMQDEIRGHRINHRVLEHLVKAGATLLGWQAGPSLNLNPSNLPTRAQLKAAYFKKTEEHPDALQVGMRAAMGALGILQAYCSWLPGEHQIEALRDLKLIERRLEEVLMWRKGIREFGQTFATGMRVEAKTVHHMLHAMRSLVRQVAEATGSDVWDEIVR